MANNITRVKITQPETEKKNVKENEKKKIEEKVKKKLTNIGLYLGFVTFVTAK